MKVKFLLVAAVVFNGAIFAEETAKSSSWFGFLKASKASEASEVVKSIAAVKAPAGKKTDAAVASENRVQKAVNAVKAASKKTYATLANYPKTVVAVAVVSAVASAAYAYSEEIFAQEEA